MRISEVMPTIKPISTGDAEAETLKRQTDDLRKRKQALKVSKARERRAQAQRAQSELQNKGL